jgi:hypothetical protein
MALIKSAGVTEGIIGNILGLFAMLALALSPAINAALFGYFVGSRKEKKGSIRSKIEDAERNEI